MRNKILDDIREGLELEGFEPDTEEFERHLIARQVRKCQEMQNVRMCQQCRAFIDCDLVRKHMMNQYAGGQK